MNHNGVLGILVLSWVLALGCGSSGPQSQAEFIAAYRAAHASGDQENVYRMIAWIDEVRPELEDPYEGGDPARRMTRKAIHWSLIDNSTNGEIRSIDVIETPEEHENSTIVPQPLYWLNITTRETSKKKGPGFDIHNGYVRLPVIEWNGVHYFYGSPHYSLESPIELADSNSSHDRVK